MEIAKSDIKASKVLYKNKCYSQSYFYFQQATEKANKANWMFNGLLNESELKSISHDQFKPLRKNLITERENIDYLNSLETKISIISENPLFNYVDIDEHKNNLIQGVKFIDSLKNKNLFDFDQSELNELLQTLNELKVVKPEFPSDFSTILKTILKQQIIWLKKFDSKDANEGANELLKILSNEKDYNDLIELAKDFIETFIILTYTSYVLFFCSILTVQHSNSTRYPQELEGKSPVDTYNEDLVIIKNQNHFLDFLNDALEKLSEMAKNYKSENNDELKTKERHFKINYTPDSTWEIFGIKSKTDFHNQFLISKNTHLDVPEKIIKELAIAEQLQSLSYFHYPVYGDAFSRLTRIFEMAVKHRANQLKINTKNKSLSQLIKLISVDYSKLYKERLDWARKMRNMNAHPDGGTIYGSMLKLPLIRLTNIINEVFRKKDFFEKEEKALNLIQNKYESFKDGLWRLDNVLIHSTEILAIREDSSLWAFYPVRQNYPQNDNDSLYSLEPIYAILRNHTMEEDGSLAGKNVRNAMLELKVDRSPENIAKLNHYKSLINSSQDSRKQMMQMTTNQSIDYQIENFHNVINSYI